MHNNTNFLSLIHQKPQAAANINGSKDFSKINGYVYFYQTKSGVMVVTQVGGLPSGTGECDHRIFAFHIHSGESCSGDENDPFANAKTHYNPKNCPHPYHSGDMPPLFGCNGFAVSVFLTDRFTVREIIGKTIIIHSSPDDFTTQPSGNSGTKIACGEIKANR